MLANDDAIGAIGRTLALIEALGNAGLDAGEVILGAEKAVVTKAAVVTAAVGAALFVQTIRVAVSLTSTAAKIASLARGRTVVGASFAAAIIAATLVCALGHTIVRALASDRVAKLARGRAGIGTGSTAAIITATLAVALQNTVVHTLASDQVAKLARGRAGVGTGTSAAIVAAAGVGTGSRTLLLAGAADRIAALISRTSRSAGAAATIIATLPTVAIWRAVTIFPAAFESLIATTVAVLDLLALHAATVDPVDDSLLADDVIMGPTIRGRILVSAGRQARRGHIQAYAPKPFFHDNPPNLPAIGIACLIIADNGPKVFDQLLGRT